MLKWMSSMRPVRFTAGVVVPLRTPSWAMATPQVKASTASVKAGVGSHAAAVLPRRAEAVVLGQLMRKVTFKGAVTRMPSPPLGRGPRVTTGAPVAFIWYTTRECEREWRLLGALCGELAYHKIKGAVGEVSVERREEAVAKKAHSERDGVRGFQPATSQRVVLRLKVARVELEGDSRGQHGGRDLEVEHVCLKECPQRRVAEVVTDEEHKA